MTSSTSAFIQSNTVVEQWLAKGDVSRAVAEAGALHRAGKLTPDNVLWLLKQALPWHAQGLLNLQREVCELVLQIVPEHYEALHLLGFAAQTGGDSELAENYFERSLKAKPDFAFARLALGQVRMMRTEFAQGHDLYEARFDAITEGSGPDWRGLPLPRWRGEPLEGKKLYIWAEQGLGDIMMFAGFLPALLKQSPARLVLGMFPKLISVLARSFPGIQVESLDDVIHLALAPMIMQTYPHLEKLSQAATIPFTLEPLKAAHDYVQKHGQFDYAMPMGDLLVHLPVAAHSSSAYLKADPERVSQTRRRLDRLGQGRRIGISWHTTNTRELARNAPLEEWLPVLCEQGYHFISLQHHVPKEEVERFCATHHCRITVDEETKPLEDAESLLALIASMDAVVTIDNSNAHLAGALGIQTALLLPKGANFRWPELPRNDTLWYGSVTALRQQELWQWKPVMQDVVQWLRG